MWNPRLAHYVSLPVSLIVILIIARDQWFFGDDWAILAPRLDASLFQPHVGHWDLIPALIFPALRNLIGLGSYTPFLMLAVVVHLAVAHLSWRILNRIGVAPWAATLASLLIMVLGAGAENILWAFQFGFMGAIAVGLVVVLLFDSPTLSVGRIVAIVVLSTIAPMFSGTAIPVLAAAAVVGIVRHGILRTALLFVPTAASYLTWYVIFVLHGAGAPKAVSTLPQALFALEYSAAMIAGGLGRALPWVGLGVIPAIAVVVWFVVTVRRGIRGKRLPAYALAIGAVIFIALTAYVRSSGGLSAAAAQRYAYVIIVLLLPSLSLLVSELVAGRPRLPAIAMVILAALVLFNLGTLEVSGEQQASREATSKSRIDAAYNEIVTHHPTHVELISPADPQWAPDLLGSDIRTLARWGQFHP
jgi:hypothetical protein